MRWCESRGERYPITLVHAQDDMNIPAFHSDVVAWHAVNASMLRGVVKEDLDREREARKRDRAEGGWTAEWQTKYGVIREERSMYGFHDKIMAYPVVGLAAFRTFRAVDPAFE